jgi:aminoglycoside phosphotransferase (APT) family kinase protein
MAKLAHTSQQRQTLAAHLGDFLSKLHVVKDVPGLPRMTPADLRNSWFQLYDDFRRESYPRLSAAEQRWQMRVFEDFLVDADSMNPPITLVHGDLGDENVLVPDDFSHLNVIDFEDAAFADPVADFCLWWGEWGDDFFEAMLKVYTGEIDPFFHQRMRFYFNRIPVFYFRLSGETGSQAAFEFGLNLLRQRMSRSS